MTDNHLEYPPSYTYNEMLNKIREGRVAYCYAGDRSGTIVIKHGGRFGMMSTDGDVGSHLDSQANNHELWSFVDDMDNSIFRQSAINSIFYIYCNFYQYLLENEINLFKELN